jgi:hypothetical protein
MVNIPQNFNVIEFDVHSEVGSLLRERLTFGWYMPIPSSRSKFVRWIINISSCSIIGVMLQAGTASVV